jgi:hypothetical protein
VFHTVVTLWQKGGEVPTIHLAQETRLAVIFRAGGEELDGLV